MTVRERLDTEPVQARENVQKLLDDLTPILRLAGVPKSQINVARGRKYRTRHFLAAFDWLHSFSLSLEFTTFQEVYALRPPEVWENYAAIGVEGLREQDMLQEAGRNLVRRWRAKRPRMFGKDKNVEAEQTEHYEN